MLSASQQVAVCPPTITDTQQVTMSGNEWSALVPNRQRPLASVTVFNGHPKKKESLVGERVGFKGMAWKFNGADVWIEFRHQGSSAIVSGSVGVMRYCEYKSQEPGTADPAKFSRDQ
jgi:hypothetical protein